MNHIGNIIKSYRNKLEISRAKFAENICSEKYVYLIEKGVRTPSANLIRMFGDRLGVDLFDHFQYLDCQNPIEVRNIMKRIMGYRQKGDFNGLKEMMEIASHLPDFQKEPWVYEFELNRISEMVFVQNRYEDSIPALSNLIQRIAPQDLTQVYMADIFVLQSVACQLTGDMIGAKRAISSAQDIFQNKEAIERHAPAIVSVRITSIAMLYKSGEFQKSIEESMKLIQFQKEMLAYERIYYSYFFLALAYYLTGALNEAIDWFKKGIYWVLINDRPMDVYYISRQQGFGDLLNNLRQDMVLEFKDKYNIS